MPPVQRQAIRDPSLLQRRERAVPRAAYNLTPLFMDRAQGSRLWDIDGRSYIDFTGGIGVANVGHAHPRVVAAVQEQLRKAIHMSWHVVMHEPYLRLAERLNQMVPLPGPNKSLFFNSGAEACENAAKIARHVTKRPALIAFQRAFHGRTLLALSLTGKTRPYVSGFGPFVPEVYRLPFEPFFGNRAGTAAQVDQACLQALDELFTHSVEPETVAAVFLEPVLGEGGFYPARPEAVRILQDTCRKHGILLVADEIQTGFGRCGALFACQRLGLAPDLLIMAKSLAGGLPLSAVTGGSSLMDTVPAGGLGSTFGGNILACAAANAVLDIIESENLPARARDIGRRVMGTFNDLATHAPTVGNARGLGAMCALEIVDPGTDRPDARRTSRIIETARDQGLLIMPASGHVICTLMPLTIRDHELDEGLRILSSAVKQVS
ncbi:MAG: aspartate aminotransferase family protein [Acidobacteriota bacterium]